MDLYNDLIGAIQQLEQWLDNTPNLLEELTKTITDSTYVSDVKAEIMYTHDNDDVRDILNNGITDQYYVEFSHILAAVRENYEEVPLQRYGSSEVHGIPVEEAISMISEQRGIIEDALTTVQTLFNTAQDELQDVAGQITSILAQVPNREGFQSYLSSLLSQLNEGVNGRNVSVVVANVLNWFGLMVTSDQEVPSEQVATFTGVAPAAVWFNAICSGAVTLSQGFLTFITSWETAVGRFWACLAGAIVNGVKRLTSSIAVGAINLVSTSLGTGRGIGATGFSGDGTVQGMGFTLNVGLGGDAYQPNVYTTVFASLIGGNEDSEKFANFYTLGAKVSYNFVAAKSGNPAYIAIDVTQRLVDPQVVEGLLRKHNLYPLPWEYINEPGKFYFEPASNPASITIEKVGALLEEAHEVDISYHDSGMYINALYARAVFYARALHYLQLWYMSEMIRATAPSIVPEGLPDEVAPYAITPFHKASYTNIELADVMCTFATLLPDIPAAVQIGGFDADQGRLPLDYTSFNNSPRGALTVYTNVGMYLFSSGVREACASGGKPYLSFLTQPFRFKPTYVVASDQQVTDAANQTLLKIGVAIVIVAAVVVAVKFIPAVIRYSRQISMQYEAAAFNYGADPTAANYAKVKSLAIKNRLLGLARTAASASSADLSATVSVPQLDTIIKLIRG